MLLDALVHLLGRHTAFDIAERDDRDQPRFLAHHDRQAIGLLGDADAGAMPRTGFRGKRRIHAQRKKTCGGADAVLLDDHGAIVQRCAWKKDRKQQVTRNLGIEPDAAFDKRSQPDIALENDQGSGMLSRQRPDRQQNLRGGFRAPVAAEETLSAEAREGPADFRLKQNDNCDGGIRGK